MKYSMYIGRVGALAVALGIGAAVATTPGIALAEGTEQGSAPPSGEAPSGPPAAAVETQSPGPGEQSNGDDGEGSGLVTDPPEMKVSGGVVDTGTHDEKTGADVHEGEDADEEEAEEEEADHAAGNEVPAGEQENPPTQEGGNGSQALAAGSGSNTQGAQQQNTHGARTQGGAPKNVNTTVVDTDPADGGAVADGAGASFRTALVADQNGSSGAETFGSLSLTEDVEAQQDPISALVTLPLRIVSQVLTAIVGGPNTPPGENPLFLGLLAFVRRQFSNFERTFSNQAPVIDDYSLVENPNGTFTVTVDTEEPDVDAFDPDGDELAFSATDGSEGTVEKTGPNTFVYTPGEDFDGDDEFTITVSDTGGLFGFNRKTATIDVDIEASEEDPTEPEVVQPPTEQPDGTFEAELQFDPEKVTDVTIAEGFEPKYWTVEEVYNPATGELELKLTPTQAGMLRAALGLDTTDSVGLQVTTTEEQTVQTFSMRLVSFAALAEEPDYTLELPELPTGHFEISPESPIVTSPGLENPEEAFPAGVVVTDRYMYVLNSRYLSSETGNSTVAVFGADPEHTEDYLQLVDEIEVGDAAVFAGLAGDRLYVVNVGQSGDDSSITIIDTDDNTLVDADDSTPEPDRIALEGSGSFGPLVSPDGNRIYVINQQAGKLFVIDTDPADLNGTYNTVIDEIQVSNGFGSPPDPETGTVTFEIPISGAFNADGSRLYLVRDVQSQTPTDEGVEFAFDGDLIVIDTASNEVIGDPVPLGEYAGYASSDGKFLYVPTLDMTNYEPMNPDLSLIPGSVTVVDIQGDVPVVVDVDPATPLIDRLPVGTLPMNIAFSPDKSLAYVVEAGSGTISVIDTVNREVLDLDPAVEGTQGIVFDDELPAEPSLITFNVIASSPDGTRLYVSNFNDGTVTVIEFVTDEEVV